MEEGKTTLVVWHAYRGDEETALSQACKRFEATHPEAHIQLVSIPFDAFPNKVSVAVPRGNGPDLFIFAHDRVGDWAMTGLIEPIGFWSDEPLLDRFFSTTIDPLVFEGSLYGLPLGFKTLALYYDTTLVKTPPKTTDELIQASKVLHQANPKVWGLGYELDSLYFHAPWLHGFGGSVYKDENSDDVTLNSPAAQASVAFVRKLVVEDKIVPEEVTSALVTSLFLKRELAFVLSGPWFRAELKDHKGWSVAPLPVVSKTGLPAKPFLGVEGVLLSAFSSHKRLGFELMTYLTSDEEARFRLVQGKQLVANQRVYTAPEVQGDPLIQAFRLQVEHTVALSNRPHMRGLWSPIKNALSKGIVHGVSPKVALDEAVDTINRRAAEGG